jgi:hypothetical protein
VSKKVFLTSHALPNGREIVTSSDTKLFIVGPPRTGKRFLSENMHSLFRIGALHTPFLSELREERKIVSIVRNPSDWIVSLVTQRILFEPGRTAKELLDIEVPAAAVALAEYVNFAGNNITFIRHEDLFNNFSDTVKLVCSILNIDCPEYPTPIPYFSNLYSYKTCRSFPEYQEVLKQIQSYDLSEHEHLYSELLKRVG